MPSAPPDPHFQGATQGPPAPPEASGRGSPSPRRIHLLGVWIAALGIAGLVFATTPRHEYYDGFDTDGVLYAANCDHWKGADSTRFDPLRSTFALAAGTDWNPATLHRRAPWNRRVLTPWLASKIPLPTYEAFALLAFLASAASLPTAFLLFRKAGFDDELAFFGMLLYAGCFWTVRFAAFSPVYVDHGTQFLLLLTLYLTLDGRYGLVAAALFLGTLQKESLAVLAPFASIHLATRRDGRSWTAVAGWTTLLAAAPAAALLGTRWMIPAENAYSPWVLFKHLAAVGNFHFWPPFLQSLFSGLGLTIPLLCMRHPPWSAFLRSRPEWIFYLLVSLAFLFGGGDKTRLWLYFLPLGLMLALTVVREFRAEAPPPRFRAWLAVYLLLHLAACGQIPPLDGFWPYLVQMAPEYAGDAFLPILGLDLALAFVFVAATALMLFNGGRYVSGVGLAPRDAPAAATS